MKYELALKLKEAGFLWNGDYFKGNDRMWVKLDTTGKWTIMETYYVNDRGPFGEEDRDTPAPTLEELIEACGENFDNLTRRKPEKWLCNYYSDEMGSDHDTEGSTPLEAVARLWLELNMK